MTLPLDIRPAAFADISHDEFWYFRRSERAAQLFLDRVDEAMRKVQASPLIYGRIEGEVRRAPVRRFPHGIFYRVYADRIMVIADYHGKRLPKGWKNRL